MAEIKCCGEVPEYSVIKGDGQHACVHCLHCNRVGVDLFYDRERDGHKLNADKFYLAEQRFLGRR